jgi:hypothetical protein
MKYDNEIKITEGRRGCGNLMYPLKAAVILFVNRNPIKLKIN